MKVDLQQRKQRLFDRWAPSYDWLFPSVFYQAIHQRLLDYVVLPDQANVLDLGCGTGRLLNRLAAHFPELRGTGFDFSAEMLRQARRCNRFHPRLIFVPGTADALPFVDDQFDAVFSSISFLHYPHPQQVFAEVSRVLKPGGCFYWVDPIVSQWSTSHQVPISPGGVRLYSAARREELGQHAGLRCQGHYYLLGFILLTIFVR
ncbi:MAG TPA: class I SAM-dependent methyltransferase [Crinalium sp.]|jgi:ubiquinone/menaquinone biosynthesis C-methylase UbiE